MEQMFYNSAVQISIQRLLSTASYAHAKRALYTFVIIGLPFGCMLWFLGIAIFAYYGQHPAEAEGITGDTALFRFVSLSLPSPIPGLMLSAMLAAVMSTLDSGMNSLAAVATKDVYIEFINRNASERQQVRFSRIMTIVVGVFAIGTALVIASVATTIKETIMEASTIWMSFGSVLAPMFLLGVTTRNVRGKHIIIGCIAAWIANAGMVVWYILSKNTDSPVSFLFVGLPGIAIILTVGYLAELLSSGQDPDKTNGVTLWTLPKEG